jgi:DNA-binding response OmpR family regulator
MGSQILIADDEPRYVRAIRFNLESSGYQVSSASNGEQAVNLFYAGAFDLVLLDVRMPRMDGFEACRLIREHSPVPIIMLTARADESDIVHGLNNGADDYITKPFSASELLARIQAVLRRYQLTRSPADDVQELGDIRIVHSEKRVYVKGREVLLTATEFHLLCELAEQQGRIVVPEYLLHKVWGTGLDVTERIVWQAVHRLRKKIEPDPKNPVYLQTRPGIGYIFLP